MLQPDQKKINAYFHPTTVVFLDDHQAFLDSIPLALKADTIYQSFLHPQQAIQYINDNTQHHPALEKDNQWSLNGSDYHYKFDCKSILHKTLNQQRFSEPSVLVTDYAMPGSDYNGLDVCKAINNPYIKKVLLTGVADEHIAIEALNNKVIDFYLKKNVQDVLPKINQLIEKYQQDYFNDMNRVLREGLTLQSPLVEDPAVVDYFFSLMKQKDIVEYHLHTELSPSSADFLLLDNSGKRYRLLLLTKEDIKVHKEIAIDAKAPSGLLKLLDKPTSIPLFPSMDGFYHPNIEDSWQDFFYPCVKIKGEDNYLAAFIEECNIITPKQRVS